ncbi:MAG: RidA family protein [Alphaproteobacteria bacterium]
MAKRKSAARKPAAAKKSAARRAAPARKAAPRKQIIGGPIVVGGNVIPISKAVRAGDYVFCSGQVPFKDGAPMVTGTIEEQTEVTMEMIKGILKEAGCSLSDVVKVAVWLRDTADFPGFNRTYAKYFPGKPPARSTVRSQLMVDVRIEIEVLAYKP